MRTLTCMIAVASMLSFSACGTDGITGTDDGGNTVADDGGNTGADAGATDGGAVDPGDATVVDPTPDVTEQDITEPVADVVADVVADDASPSTDVSTGDVAGSDTADVAPDERYFEQIVTGLSSDFVYKGIFAQPDGRLVLVGNDGVVATRSPDDKWSVINEGEGSPLLNAVAGVDAGDLWAVGIDGTIMRGDAEGFQPYGGGGCETDAECNNSDACTIDSCVDGMCTSLAVGGPGCCGNQVANFNFDSGTMDGWMVDSALGLTWQSSDERSSSPPYAMYFGDPNKTPPDYDTGEQVGAVLVSPPIVLPQSGTATLTFDLYLDVEADGGYDLFTVEIDGAGAPAFVWSKAQLDSLPTVGFVPVSIDLTKYMGQSVSVRFIFDTVDGQFNTFEGAYVDNVVVDTTCDFTQLDSGFPTLWGATALAEDDVYAVGMQGTIAQWNGHMWRSVGGAGTDVTWFGLHGAGDSLALVGTGGQIKLSIAGQIVEIESPTGATLRDVYTADGETFWAVGDGSVIVKGEGQVWTMASTPPLKGHFYSVHGNGPDNIYAVGQAGQVVHYDGTAWSVASNVPASVATLDLKAVWVDDTGTVTITGKDGLILQGSIASGFTHFGNLFIGGSLDGAWGVDGERVLVGENSQIWHHVGSWNQDTPIPTTQHLRDVWGPAANDLWAVGLTGVLNHWDGTAWTKFEGPTGSSLEAIWGRASDDIYAAGASGTILKFNGEDWTVIASQTDKNLRDVFGFPGGDVWAVGSLGTIMRRGELAWASVVIDPKVYDDGSEEYYVTHLHGVWGAAPDDVWAVGEGGDLFHWDGVSWIYFEDATFGISLRDIHGLAADDIWAVGSEGHMLHWDGEAWSPWDTGSVATLYDITSDGAGNIYVVGDIGTVLRLTSPDE
ncbi:MAG: hypothetical protein QF464_00745 [Myxococcota bacterium]|nr:hypothetical protein [Myxococcota bacterium]